MDIKSFILVGGGLLIAAVVAHGFWIAWRDRRQDLRIDIKPDLIPDEMDDMDRLRGELPNGGARTVRPLPPEQEPLDLEEPPVLQLEPTEGPPASAGSAAGRRGPPETAGPEEVDALLLGVPFDEEDSPAAGTASGGRRAEPVVGVEPAPSRPQPVAEEAAADGARAKVADVKLPDPIVADEPRRPRRLGQRRSAGRDVGSAPDEGREATAPPPVEELIVMNVLAAPGSPYTGDELFAALRSCGLKFGDMNIFHRVEPLTRAVQYSVASAVEPGTFDMAEMEAIRCPGLCMFMQLPGPEDPGAAFDDMLSVARSVVGSLGGDIKDEHRNVMTPQTVAHYRQRITDFSRRRMSRRA